MTLLAVTIFLILALSAYASVFDFEVVDAEGKTVSLSAYKSAKAILIVNVASNCGYTQKNYRGLREIYDNLHEKGLEILAFPSNQFSNQEPGTDSDIQEFCKNNGVVFPVFSKINVNGPSAHPLYKYLKRKTGSLEIRWNFNKILVVNGIPVRRYSADVDPSDM
eukprot:gene31268-35294_t